MVKGHLRNTLFLHLSSSSCSTVRAFFSFLAASRTSILSWGRVDRKGTSNSRTLRMRRVAGLLECTTDDSHHNNVFVCMFVCLFVCLFVIPQPSSCRGCRVSQAEGVCGLDWTVVCSPAPPLSVCVCVCVYMCVCVWLIIGTRCGMVSITPSLSSVVLHP